MDARLLKLFQGHVAEQCTFALFGVPLIEKSLPVGNHDMLWVGCQQFVVGAANVSKALWGTESKLYAEREPLRNSLNISDDSPLRRTSLRNHFEHYDERLDRWWQNSKSRNFLSRMIGPPEAVQGMDDGDRFWVYDPATHRIIFWGEEFEIGPMVAELNILREVAATESRKPDS